jgi:hypothetical protein
MAFPPPAVYVLSMSRIMCLSIAVVLSLLPVVAPAAPIHKRPASLWHGYGFLPGYHQPLNNSLPLYAQKNGTRRLARQERRPWYIDPVPGYYGYDGNRYYFGQPGINGGRYNGGSFGPCWTRTPIGAVWNCG